MTEVKQASEGRSGRQTAAAAVETGNHLCPRGAIVLVDDGWQFHARIVAVIGVVAVIVYRPEAAAGEVCRAVPVRCCSPRGDESLRRDGRAGANADVSAPSVPSGPRAG